MADLYAILDRAKLEAEYIIETGATVRQTAKEFGTSKSTVHKDLTERLLKIDTILYYKVREVLNSNAAQRAIRGGMSTKRKYKK